MGSYLPRRKMNHCHFGVFLLSANDMLLANQMLAKNVIEQNELGRIIIIITFVRLRIDCLYIYAYIPHNIYIYTYIYTYIIIPSSKS